MSDLNLSSLQDARRFISAHKCLNPSKYTNPNLVDKAKYELSRSLSPASAWNDNIGLEK